MQDQARWKTELHFFKAAHGKFLKIDKQSQLTSSHTEAKLDNFRFEDRIGFKGHELD